MIKNLCLKTVDKNFKSYGGFQWPSEVGAIVECSDWNPAPICGGGLHGLFLGQGDQSLLSFFRDDIGIVFEALGDIIALDGKIKCPRARVLFIGPLLECCLYIARQTGCCNLPLLTCSQTGYSGTATQTGYGGTATQTGDSGTATQTGFNGFAIQAGDHGLAVQKGNCGTAVQTGRNGSARVDGDGSVAMSFNRAMAGPGGIIAIRYYEDRWRLVVGYVGEDGIKPDTWYVVKNGKLERE